MKILGLKLCVSISTIVKCDIIIIRISLSVVVVVVAVGVVAFSIYIHFYAHVAPIYPSGSFLFSHRKFKFVTAPLNANEPRRIYYATAAVIVAILHLSSSRALLTSCQ